MTATTSIWSLRWRQAIHGYKWILEHRLPVGDFPEKMLAKCRAREPETRFEISEEIPADVPRSRAQYWGTKL